MANDNSRDGKLHQSLYRPVDVKRSLKKRKTQIARTQDSLPHLSIEKTKQAGIKYLETQIQLQVDKPLPNSLSFSRLQQKQLFHTAFTGALNKLKVEEKSSILDILSGKSAGPMAKLQEALAIAPIDIVDDGKESRLARLLLQAVSGSSGRPGNDSNLLMQFLENHHQQIRPLVQETIKTGVVPTFLRPSELLEGLSGGRDFSDKFLIAEDANFRVNDLTRILSTKTNMGHTVLPSNSRNGFISAFKELETKLGLLKEKGSGEIRVSDPVYRRMVSPHGNGELKGKVGSFQVEFNLISPDSASRQVRLSIPQLTALKTNLPGFSHTKDIGFTGNNLDVRRTNTPYAMMEQRGMEWTKHKELGRDEFYLRSVIGEVIDPLLEGTIDVRQADAHLKKLKSIITDAEMLGASTYNLQPAQETLEDVRSGATTIIQPAAAGTTDIDTGVPLKYEHLTPDELVEFQRKNPSYGADLAPGKIAAGMLSKVDLSMYESIAASAMTRARPDQAIRITTPSAASLIHAYQDPVSSEKITRSLDNFREQQRWVRKQFYKTTEQSNSDAARQAFFQMQADIERARKEGRTYDPNKGKDPQIAHTGGLSNRAIIANGGLNYSPTAITQSTVLETNQSGYRPVKDPSMSTRMMTKENTMRSLIQKIEGTHVEKRSDHANYGNVTTSFGLTNAEYEMIAEIAERKNIPVWKLKQMSNEAWKKVPESSSMNKQAKQSARSRFQSQRHLAKMILEADDQVEPGRLRRQMLSMSNAEGERQVHNFTSKRLPNVIGAQAGSIENIPDQRIRGKTSDVLSAIQAVKEGKHPFVSGGTPAEQKQMLGSFLEKEGGLLPWLKNNFGNEEINYAYHNMAMKKDAKGLDLVRGFAMSPLPSVKGDDAFSEMHRLLAKNEGVLNVGTYYVHKGDFLDETTRSLPFGKGGALNSPEFKRMSSYDLAGQTKLSFINNIDLFNMDNEGNISLNEEHINQRDSGRGVFIGLDGNGNPKYLSKQMINSNEFTATDINLVGNTLEDMSVKIEYRQTHRVEELSKTQGDSKEGGAYAKTRKDYDDAVKTTAAAHGNPRGARVLSNSRHVNDKLTFTEMFEKGKRPQLHNRQMLTALAAHQMSHMRAFAGETTDPKLNQGSHWMKKYADQMIKDSVEISAPSGTDSKVRRVSASMLLKDMDKFRYTLQEGVGKITKPLDKSGKIKWGKTWEPGHREGTKKLMEWFLKQGIELQEIMNKGSTADKINPMLHDKSRNWLHLDYFSEIFGATGAHFGKEDSRLLIREVLDMNVSSGGNETIGGALSRMFVGKNKLQLEMRAPNALEEYKMRAEADVGSGVVTNKITETINNLRKNVGDEAANAYESAAKAKAQTNLDIKMGTKSAPTLFQQHVAAQNAKAGLVKETIQEAVERGFIEAGSSGTVFGAARINWGDPISQQGAGKMATLEPRFLDIMSNPQFGLYGDEAIEEMLGHVSHHDASSSGEGKLAIHAETEKMLQSLSGNMTPDPKNDVIIKADMTEMNPQEVMGKIESAGQQIIEDGRGQSLFLDAGGKGGPIYIPPTDMAGMKKHTIEEAGGRMIPAQAQIAGHIDEYLHSMTDKRIGPEDAKKNLIESIGKEWAIEGKGMGAVTRNRIPASMFMTGAKTNTLGSNGIEAIQDMFKVQVSARQAEVMFRQLENTGMHEQAGIDEMRLRLLGNKKQGVMPGQVAGFIFRHPGIGPLSMQKVMYEIAEGASDATIYVPEVDFHVNLDILDEANSNLEQGIRKFRPHQEDILDPITGKPTGQKKKVMTSFTFGPTQGMSMDFDFDTPGAGFYGPKLEAKIFEELDSRNRLPGQKGSRMEKLQAYTRGVVEHNIRYQLIKSADTETGTSMSELSGSGFFGNATEAQQISHSHITAAEKLAIADSNIGKLSSQITMAKRAAMSAGLEAADLAAINTLSEWIEQKPIGFKHVDPETIKTRIGKLSTGFEQMTEAGLRQGITAFIGEDAMNMLTKKTVHLSPENVKKFSEESGVRISNELRGIDLDRILPIWAGALRNHAEAEKIGQNVHRGKGGAAAITKEMNLIHVESGAGMKPNAVGRLIGNAEQVVANLSGAAGRSVIMDHKGIAALAAIGGLAALSSMESQPREMIGPGRHLNMNAKPHMNSRKAHKRITANDVRPMKAPLGSPTGPNLLSQRRAMIASNPIPRDKFAITARANHPDDISMISQQFQGFAASAGYVSINNSSRQINNPYGEINKQY
jgi:hypothetical protein